MMKVKILINKWRNKTKRVLKKSSMRNQEQGDLLLKRMFKRNPWPKNRLVRVKNHGKEKRQLQVRQNRHLMKFLKIHKKEEDKAGNQPRRLICLNLKA